MAVIALLLGIALTVAAGTSNGRNASAGSSSLDFSLGLDYASATGDECDTTAGSTTCSVPDGDVFQVNTYLNNLGGSAAYKAIGVYLGYSGVTTKSIVHIEGAWPDCAAEGPTSGPSYTVTGCSTLLNPPSTYLGLVATTQFTCSADGTITMVHGNAETLLIDDDDQTQVEAGPNETFTIDCVAPLSYPGDSDGDGCPDMNEAALNPMAGGQRNFLNAYDYFNPSHDGENRIDDVLEVVNQYFVDQGNGGYTADTDRTLIGPDAWNLGPPNGLQRIDDILNQVKQYFHDCA